MRIVRAHVQDTKLGHGHAASFTVGPGRYWIRGHHGWDDRTLAWVVNAYHGAPPRAERQAAVNSFNHQHGTQHQVV
jgi:hypothetical protein